MSDIPTENQNTQPKRILSFDLGQTFGWSVLKFDPSFATVHYLASGVVKLKVNPTKRNPNPAKWHSIWEASVYNLAAEYNATHIAFEDVKAHSAIYAAHCYGFLKFSLINVTAERGATLIAVPVKSAKKVATGNGNAKKDLVLYHINKKFFEPETDITDHNEADALAVGLAAIKTQFNANF